MRYELTDFEWAAIRSFLPNKPRGIPRVDDRRVLNGVFLGLALRCSLARAFIKLAAIRIWLVANESMALKIISGRCHPPVNSGNSGDIFSRLVAVRPASWLNGSSYGDGRPSRRFGLQFATVPICSGTRSGCGPGDRPPVQIS
jgi:hypothetical protein